MLVYNFEQRTPEWYKVREGKITASNILSILGKESLAKTQQAIDNMAMELAIESVHGMIEDTCTSFDMQRGIDLEQFAYEHLSEQLQLDFLELTKVGFIEHSEHIGSSPDGYIKGVLVAEIKAPTAKNFFKLTLTNEVDEKHIAQMQHQMFCAEVDKAIYYPFCIHNSRPFSYRKDFNRDEAMIKLIKERCDIVTEKKLQYIETLKKAQL